MIYRGSTVRHLFEKFRAFSVFRGKMIFLGLFKRIKLQQICNTHSHAHVFLYNQNHFLIIIS